MSLRSLLQTALTSSLSALLLAHTVVGTAGAAAPVAPAISTSGTGSRATAPTAAGSRIPWQGGSWYLNGVNIPWFNWGCDFGCGSSGGVSDPNTRQWLEQGFGAMQANGVKVARWWVLEGDPWQIKRDANNAPVSLDPRVFQDMDAAIELAEKYDVYYSFTLFSAPTAVPEKWLTDPGQRAKLVEVLTPLFARYKDNPRVMTWDLINEPDWDIWKGAIALEPVRETVKALAVAVHANSTAYVTVGAAMLDGLPHWKGLGLDFYQAHWYDFMSPGAWCALCTDYATVEKRYGLDRPLVIGEFYGGKDVDAQRFQDWHTKGYAGSYAWSLFSDKTGDKLQINLDAARAFASQHADTQIRRVATVAQAEAGSEPAA